MTPARILAVPLVRRVAVPLVIAVLLVGALFLRLPGITKPSIEQRETQSALRIRVAVARRRHARAVLAGLALGYLVFAATFAYYISGNPYYSLPLIPILSLAIGVIAGFGPRARAALPGSR